MAEASPESALALYKPGDITPMVCRTGRLGGRAARHTNAYRCRTPSLTGPPNNLIKQCDREASAFITALESGERAWEARPVLKAPCSHFLAHAFKINMVPPSWIRPGTVLPFSTAYLMHGGCN